MGDVNIGKIELPKGIPVYMPHKISIIEAKPKPLYVPIGKSASAIFGLEVFFPYLSAAYLSGNFLFLFLKFKSLFHDIIVVAISKQ